MDAYSSDFGLTKTNVLGGQWALDWTENPTRFPGARGLPLNPENPSSVTLKYTQDRDSVISGLQRVSKPGRRRYTTADQLPKVLGGMGTAIITTSSGVMTGNEARRKGVGGEVVAFVW